MNLIKMDILGKLKIYESVGERTKVQAEAIM